MTPNTPIRCTGRKPGIGYLGSVAVSFLVAVAAAGCDAYDSVKEGFAHSQAISTELEKSLGTKTFVGFNWNNGTLNAVTVTFDGVPKGRTLQEIADVSRAAVLKEFKQTPEQIVIAFSFKP